MLRQLLMGTAVSLCNIGIHALVMTAVVQVAHRAGATDTSRQSLRLIAVMVGTASVLMVAHVSEVIVWSLAYAIVDAAPAGADVFYFAFVKLHDSRLRRRHAGRALAAARADDRDERRTAVRLVDRRHLRSAAENGETRAAAAGPNVKGGEGS
jgi:hypothetical protein